MKKYTFLVLLFPFIMLAQAPAGYYDGTSGLTGYALKSKVHEIISKNYNWHYGDLQEYYKQTDLDVYYDHTSADNPNNGIYILLDVYSEIPGGPDSYEYNSTQLQSSSGISAEGQGWNREHVIPQSTFSTGSVSNYPMYSDLFSVIPVDAYINQRRSNYPYGIAGSSPFYTFSNTSKIANNATPGYAYTGRVYEPINEFKGDIARILLYFAVRYESKLPSFNFLLSGTGPANDQSPLDGTAERAYDEPYIAMLKQWNALDPVSQREIDRNNAVFNIQKNRNPFIDHPEWVNMIWSETPDAVPPSAPSNLTVTQQNASFVNLNWSPSAEPDVLGYKIFMNGATTPVATVKGTSVSIDRLVPSTTYTFTVKAYDKGYLESPESNTATATTLASDSFAKDLMITKFLEGSGNNRAIEITNKTGHEVNLNNYNLNIQMYSGTNYYFSDSFQLEGKVAPGETFVVLNPNAAFACYTNPQAKFVTASPPMTYSGTQYVELAYKGFTTVDAVGTKGVSNATGNQSLYRLSSVTNPTATFDLNEWQHYPSDYCQNLGVLSSADAALAQNDTFVYPNPVNDGMVYVSGKNYQKISTATVYDLAGRMVYETKNPFGNGNSLNLMMLKTGSYLLKLDQKTFKIIIK